MQNDTWIPIAAMVFLFGGFMLGLAGAIWSANRSTKH